MKIQIVSQASKMEEGRVEKFQRCSRKCWKLFECRFHGRGNRGNGRKERNAETNFRPSSNRPWWSDKHRKRWVYHLRSYPLKSSFHPSLSLCTRLSLLAHETKEKFLSTPFFDRRLITHAKAIQNFHRNCNSNSFDSFVFSNFAWIVISISNLPGTFWRWNIQVCSELV